MLYRKGVCATAIALAMVSTSTQAFGSRGGLLATQNIIRKYSIATSTTSAMKYPVVSTFSQDAATMVLVQCPSKEEFLATETMLISDLQQTERILAEELQTMEGAQGSNRLNLYLGGRIAAKESVYAAGSSTNAARQPLAIGKNHLGAPVFPHPWTGSISHKHSYALAACVPSELGTIGVDLEQITNGAAEKLQRRLLTEREQQTLGSVLSNREMDIMLRFSFKEAVFKALNPHLQRYIDFKEVEVFPRDDHTAELAFHLRGGGGGGGGAAGALAEEEEFAFCQRYQASWRLVRERR
eukprot:gene2883-2105_t